MVKGRENFIYLFNGNLLGFNGRFDVCQRTCWSSFNAIYIVLTKLVFLYRKIKGLKGHFVE